ncbi:MAG: energy transducer TonB [Bacteroidales bacterium]|nr:energy transducer TonB [Bacteroidales bacterium]
MKRTAQFVLSLILLFGGYLFAQTTDTETDNMAISDQPKPELRVETEEDAQLNFMELFEIKAENSKKAKTLGEALFRKEPNPSSENWDFVIPQGTIVETYKYFPKEAAWAIKYNNHWGFVSATMIMPVKEQTVASNFTPYDEAPQLLTAIKPKYPPDAKKNGIEGKVVVKILISKTGAVTETEIAKSIPELDAAAIDAIKKVKFKPGKYKGKPVDVWVRIPINFEIEKF